MKDLIRKLEKKFSIKEIENTAIKCFVDNNNLGFIFSNELINHKIQKYNEDCYKMIQKDLLIKDLETLNSFFEGLLSEKEKNENGIVFTPLYICDYIVKNTIRKFDINTKIIDPSCGCGIFIISTLNYIRKKTNIKIIDLLEKNIYKHHCLKKCVFYLTHLVFLLIVSFLKKSSASNHSSKHLQQGYTPPGSHPRFRRSAVSKSI